MNKNIGHYKKINQGGNILNNNLDITRLESIKNANSSKKVYDSTARMEDYLEVIFELVQNKGYATTVDISKYLNVRSPSVTKMVQRLDENGLLEYEKYRGIRLTEKGIQIAISTRKKHELLSDFFRLIGVDKETADKDAEGLEHHLHPESIKKLEKFVNFLKKNQDLFNN